jgi:DNA repair protein RadC
MKLIEKNLPRLTIQTTGSEFKQVKITSSSQAADLIRQFYGDDIFLFESFFILLLNQANMAIGYAKISQGGMTSTIVDKRIIAHYAINSLATSIILAHNHPSGNLTPSATDISITEEIIKGMKLLDIVVFDHLILVGGAYTSMVDEGLIRG